MTEIAVGCRVRTDAWPDLQREVGTVRQVHQDRAQVLWDRAGLGASWLAVSSLIVLV